MVNDSRCNAPCGRAPGQSPNRSFGGNISFNPQVTSTPEGQMSFAGAPPGNMSFAGTPTRAGSPNRTTRVTRVERTPTGTKRTTSETKLYSSTPTQTGQPANLTFPPVQPGPALNETYDIGPAQMNQTYHAVAGRADATYVVDDGMNYSDYDDSHDSYLQGMQDFIHDITPIPHDASMGRRMQHLDRQENMEWNAANQEFQRRVNNVGLDDSFYDRQRMHLIEALRDLEMRYAQEREAMQQDAMDNAGMLGDEPPALPGTPQRRGAGARRNLFGAPRGDSPPPGLANDPRAVRRPGSPMAMPLNQTPPPQNYDNNMYGRDSPPAGLGGAGAVRRPGTPVNQYGQPQMFDDNNMYGRDSPPAGLGGAGAVRRPGTPDNQYGQPQMFDDNDLFGAPRGRDSPPAGLGGRGVRRPASPGPGDLMNESPPSQIFEESIVEEIFDETPPQDLFYSP